MAAPVTVRRSRLVESSVDTVFEAALSTPLPELYRRRYGPMPPIVEVQDQHGAWETPGQTRVIVLADGGRMREELRSVDRPHRFDNRLTVLTGPFAPLVARVDESWSFRSVGADTEATWEWNLVAKSAVSRFLVPIVARLWLGYAGAVLEQLSDEVRGSTAP